MKGLVIGATASGKTSLCNALAYRPAVSRPTLMLRKIGDMLDTPGIYLESPSLRNALIVGAQQVDYVLMLAAADNRENPAPTGFAQAFCRPMFGGITKINTPGADIESVKGYLLDTGAVGPFLYLPQDEAGIRENFHRWRQIALNIVKGNRG